MISGSASPVIDSSFVLAYLLPDETMTAEEIAVIEGAPLVAPDLIVYEVANSIALARRKGRLVDGHEVELVNIFSRLPIETVPCRSAAALVILANRYTLTVNDAAYLDLAIQRGAPLITRDKALAAAAEAAGMAAP
ncbi:MAG: type II toxin-antitoxin system VapC family toxin [Paracoccaceae bacterium]